MLELAALLAPSLSKVLNRSGGEGRDAVGRGHMRECVSGTNKAGRRLGVASLSSRAIYADASIVISINSAMPA